MFIEYKDGEKHTGKIDRAELSENITTFNSCGELIADNEVVIDIDHLPKESIKAMIQEFGIKTQVVWTERGAHLWFKKPVWFTRRHDGVCKLGFEIEQHTMQSNPGGMTVRRNGVTRDIDNIGLRAYMPDIFQVGTKKKPYQNLTGMDDGDGRNKALFAQRKALNNCQDWEKMLGFINKHVFATPLTDDEFGTILRDISEDSETDDKYWIASDIIQKCHTVLYSGMIWWMKDGQYIADADNKVAKKVKKDIQSAAPALTGRYKKSWKVTKTDENNERLVMTVHAGRYQLTHLLEHGHAKRGGGRVRAIPHIAPAEEEGVKELEDDIKEALEKGGGS